MQCDQAQSLLDRYIDNEIDGAQARVYERHIAQCRICQRRIDAHQALRAQLRQAPRTQAPEGLRARVLAQTERATTPRSPHRARAATIASLGIAIAVAMATFGYRAVAPTADLVQETVAGYIRAQLSPRSALGVVAGDTHTVKPWLVSKLDFAPPVPSLSAHGFELVGARLDYANGRTVAAIVYRRRAHAIDLFVWPSVSTQAPRAHRLRGYHAAEWAAGGMHYLAVSDLNPAELGEFAERVRALIQ